MVLARALALVFRKMRDRMNRAGINRDS